MYYPTIVQPTSTGAWPNAYQINPQQQQQQQQQQQVPTIYYQLPPVSVPALPPTTTSEVIFQQLPPQQPQTTSSTVSKTITTRILDPATLPTVASNPAIEETKTITTVSKPEEPTVVTSNGTDVPQVSTTTVVPTSKTTIIREKPQYRTRRTRALSPSTSSDDTTTSSNSTVIPRNGIIHQQAILPSQIPLQTTNMYPPARVIHRPQRPTTPSGYESSDLDYGKRRVYKTDYKYRHFYYCNWCKGRCDLRNRSYGCCEWFYGFPLWALILFTLLFLALLAGFLALFALQPTINPVRRAQTAETYLVNRSQIVYGFYQNCGYLVNVSNLTNIANLPTTLILCINTKTTTTAQVQLSPFSTLISGTNSYSYNRILILFFYLFISKIYQLNRDV